MNADEILKVLAENMVLRERYQELQSCQKTVKHLQEINAEYLQQRNEATDLNLKFAEHVNEVYDYGTLEKVMSVKYPTDLMDRADLIKKSGYDRPVRAIE
jgi:uncharacterized coiled-coil DUF342 family protein